MSSIFRIQKSFLALTINPAPQGIEHETEIFGTYEYKWLAEDPDYVDRHQYRFHLWMEKEDEQNLFGEVYLPFTCTQPMFCIYKSESETEEGGKVYNHLYFRFLSQLRDKSYLVRSI